MYICIYVYIYVYIHIHICICKPSVKRARGHRGQRLRRLLRPPDRRRPGPHSNSNSNSNSNSSIVSKSD